MDVMEIKKESSPDADWTRSYVKEEIDIGPTEIQPPDAYYKLLSTEPVKIKSHAECVDNTSEYDVSSFGAVDENLQIQENTLPKKEYPYTKSQLVPKEELENKKAVQTKKYICDVCGKIFNNRAKIITHLKHENTMKNFKKFAKFMVIFKEFRIFNDLECYQCSMCDQTFKSKGGLTRHTRTTHNKSASSKTVAESDSLKCKNTSTNISKSDQKANKDKFKCEYCRKQFNLEKHLICHTRLHTGKNAPKCTLCNTHYVNHKALKRHMTIHVENKPYKCSRCDKSFGHVHSLRSHEKVYHMAEKKHHCPLCERRFDSLIFYRNHVKICDVLGRETV